MKIIEQSLKKWENCSKNSKLRYLTCTEQSQFPNMLEIIFSDWWSITKYGCLATGGQLDLSSIVWRRRVYTWPPKTIIIHNWLMAKACDLMVLFILICIWNSLNFSRKYGFLGTDVLSNSQLYLRSMEYFRTVLSLKKKFKR